jgi:starch phosphorylase
MAYDTPVPGFNTYNTNNLRLWRSRPRNTFDFNKFNSSDYHGAIGDRQDAEYITSVLYPNDSTDAAQPPFMTSSEDIKSNMVTIDSPPSPT